MKIVARSTPTPVPGAFPVAGTQYRLINRNSGKDLDVSNCSTADGGNIQQWPWLNNNCHQWQVIP